MRTCGFKGSLFKSGRCSRVGGGPGTGAHGGSDARGSGDPHVQ